MAKTHRNVSFFLDLLIWFTPSHTASGTLSSLASSSLSVYSMSEELALGRAPRPTEEAAKGK